MILYLPVSLLRIHEHNILFQTVQRYTYIAAVLVIFIQKLICYVLKCLRFTIHLKSSVENKCEKRMHARKTVDFFASTPAVKKVKHQETEDIVPYVKCLLKI